MLTSVCSAISSRALRAAECRAALYGIEYQCDRNRLSRSGHPGVHPPDFGRRADAPEHQLPSLLQLQLERTDPRRPHQGQSGLPPRRDALRDGRPQHPDHAGQPRTPRSGRRLRLDVQPRRQPGLLERYVLFPLPQRPGGRARTVEPDPAPDLVRRLHVGAPLGRFPCLPDTERLLQAGIESCSSRYSAWVFT